MIGNNGRTKNDLKWLNTNYTSNIFYIKVYFHLKELINILEPRVQKENGGSVFLSNEAVKP